MYSGVVVYYIFDVCVINVVTVRGECMRIETNIRQCVRVRANRQRDMKRRITYHSLSNLFG